MKTTGAVLREGSVPGCEGLTCQSPNEGHSTARTHLGRPTPLAHARSHTSSYGPRSKYRHLFFIPLPTVVGFFYQSHLTWKASVVNATALLFIKSISSPND